MTAAKLPHEWTASVLVLRPDRRVLLVFHDKLGVWLGPGGHVEPGESPDQAALREVREETGLSIALVGARDPSLEDPAHGVECLTLPYVILKELIPDARRPHIHLDLIYCARLTTSVAAAEATITSDHQARFATEAEIPALPMFSNFRALLARVFADRAVWRAISAGRAVPAPVRTVDVDADADLQP